MLACLLENRWLLINVEIKLFKSCVDSKQIVSNWEGEGMIQQYYRFPWLCQCSYAQQTLNWSTYQPISTSLVVSMIFFALHRRRPNVTLVLTCKVVYGCISRFFWELQKIEKHIFLNRQFAKTFKTGTASLSWCPSVGVLTCHSTNKGSLEEPSMWRQKMTFSCVLMLSHSSLDS